MSHPPVKHVLEQITSLTLLGVGLADWIPWILATPAALYYCWMLWEKWKARK